MTIPTSIEWLTPDWPGPPGVRAVATTRVGGVSAHGWAGLNLATHVGDDPAAVRRNRQLLREALHLPAEPDWLQQVHGVDVRELPNRALSGCQADAAFTAHPGQVCAVLTADCLPLLMCDRDGQAVAAVHAGWRGLLAGVIEHALQRFADPRQVLVWLGPAIGPQAFEVGPEVRDAFVGRDERAAQAFRVNRPGHWLADIYQLARQRLDASGVGGVYGGGLCTYSDPDRFYSYRREPVTGRMASLIWIEP